MMVDQVQIHGVLVLEASDDSPVGANRDGPEPAQVASERMQAETGQVHLFRNVRRIQLRKDVFDPVANVRPDLRFVASLVQPSQSSMPEAPDHAIM